MKAPDKIYVPIVDLGVEDGECTAPTWWNKDKTAEHSDVVKAIEYIRKDLLLEWLEERVKYYRGLIPADGAVAFICALGEVEHKIESI